MSPDDGHVDAAGHRVVGEEVLPQARRQFADPVGRVGVDALEDIGQIGCRADPEQEAGGDEAVDDPDVPRAGNSPGGLSCQAENRRGSGKSANARAAASGAAAKRYTKPGKINGRRSLPAYCFRRSFPRTDFVHGRWVRFTSSMNRSCRTGAAMRLKPACTLTISSHICASSAQKSRECLLASQKRHRRRTIELGVDKVYEKLEVIKQGAVSAGYAKAIEDEIHEVLLEMKTATDFQLFKQAERRALRSQLKAVTAAVGTATKRAPPMATCSHVSLRPRKPSTWRFLTSFTLVP